MSDSGVAGPLFVGLMSGTSMDGVDAVLVRFGERSVELVTTRSHAFDAELGARLIGARRDPRNLDIDAIGTLDTWLGSTFADAALALLADAGVTAADVTGIGSHGQTIRHMPRAARPFTLQLGDPSLIASRTGITTVADFRRRDLAEGGEGAPLAPAFHQWLLQASHPGELVLNLGGIANLTRIGARPEDAIGFDTGPGNTLLDAWIAHNTAASFDSSGAWAASGSVNEPLLARLMADDYLAAQPPKSTGFEYFNLDWLDAVITASGAGDVDAVDVQTTLAEFTAASVAAAIERHAADAKQVFVCGGGVHNLDLMHRLARRLAPRQVATTEVHGVEPDWVEAAAFAWLAKQTLAGQAGNLPTVTGARRAAVLGGIYAATPAD